MAFGQRLRVLRDEKGQTQEELGRLLGFVKSTVSQWETDDRIPTPDVLQRLAEHFDVSIDYLVGHTEFRDPAERIAQALATDVDLAAFWQQIRQRNSLKLLFQQVRDLDDDSIKRIMRVVRAIEEEEKA